MSVLVPKSYRSKGQPRRTRNEFPIRADLTCKKCPGGGGAGYCHIRAI